MDIEDMTPMDVLFALSWVSWDDVPEEMALPLLRRLGEDADIRVPTRWGMESRSFEWTDGYAASEPEAAPEHGVVRADWNDLPECLFDLFERYGFGAEWSDQWSTCGQCYQSIRTEPDSYCWKPAFHVTHGDIICDACWNDEDMYDTENDPGR